MKNKTKQICLTIGFVAIATPVLVVETICEIAKDVISETKNVYKETGEILSGNKESN